MKGCPEARPTGSRDGARPILENSTACQIIDAIFCPRSGAWLVAPFCGCGWWGFGVSYPLVETNELLYCWFVRLRLGFGPFMGSKFVSAAFSVVGV